VLEVILKKLIILCWFLSLIAFASTSRVIRVVDGDTLLLSGYDKSIRLIGIDTPESVRNERAQSQAERTRQPLEAVLAHGKAAKAFIKQFVGREVWVQSDVQARDRYGRHLLYVFFADPRGDFRCDGRACAMLNAEILRAGHGDLLTIAPNVRFVEYFRAAVAQARRERIGIWK
jgi:micrococcal nuclease